MADQNHADAGAAGANTNTENAAAVAGVDTSKFTQADWDKVYTDPKLYENPRFKSLTDSAKKARELEAAKNKADEDALVKNKQFEELAAKKEQEANDWRSKAEQASINNSIALEATKLGVIDVEAATKLLDKSAVKLNEDGSVSGVAEALKTLVESKPYLVNKDEANRNMALGAGTAPGANGNQGTPRFKLSQLNDARFYRANQKDIEQAYKLGLIENDLGQHLATS